MVGLVRALGFAAVGFSSAARFLSSNDRRRTACLIADVQMPGMNGLELLLFLNASGSPVPTILITAYPSEAVRRHALNAGAHGYLTKPFIPDDLLACLNAATAPPDPSAPGPRT